MVRYLSDAWLVIALSVVFGGALAGVHVTLNDRIEANRLNETLAQIPSMVPGAVKGEVVKNGSLYRALDAEGKPAGYVIQARAQGFADVIQILIGVDARVEALTGLYVLEQKETPGLGNKIDEPEWRKQFVGKKAAQSVELVKGKATGAQQITAVSGATISSQTVCDIVNSAVANLRKELSTLEKK